MDIKTIGAAVVSKIEHLIQPMVGRNDLAKIIGYIENAGAPSAVVPDFIGQRLFDTTNLQFYWAFGVAAGNWAPLPPSTLTAGELAVLDGATAGTAVASKALVVDASKNITGLGSVLSTAPTGGGVGYATGAGGAVSQLTNRSTGVTINTLCGTITGDATSLAGLAEATFVVTNSAVALRDTIILSLVSGPTANTSQVSVSAVAAGSFTIKIRNMHATTADTGAPIINFAVLKAANA